MDHFFLIHSTTLCLLIGTFSLFTFKMIIDKYIIIAILLSSGFYLVFSVPFFFSWLFPSSLMICVCVCVCVCYGWIPFSFFLYLLYTLFVVTIMYIIVYFKLIVTYSSGAF